MISISLFLAGLAVYLYLRYIFWPKKAATLANENEGRRAILETSGLKYSVHMNDDGYFIREPDGYEYNIPDTLNVSTLIGDVHALHKAYEKGYEAAHKAFLASQEKKRKKAAK
jgi:hypothetical protein